LALINSEIGIFPLRGLKNVAELREAQDQEGARYSSCSAAIAVGDTNRQHRELMKLLSQCPARYRERIRGWIIAARPDNAGSLSCFLLVLVLE
jgi:hypothetical protein